MHVQAKLVFLVIVIKGLYLVLKGAELGHSQSRKCHPSKIQVLLYCLHHSSGVPIAAMHQQALHSIAGKTGTTSAGSVLLVQGGVRLA